MPIPELQAENGAQATRLRTGSAKQTSNRRVLAMSRRNGHLEDGLEEILSFRFARGQ